VGREAEQLGRAFDKAVRRKPLAGAADAGCYGNSSDFCLKSLADRDFGQEVIIDAHRLLQIAWTSDVDRWLLAQPTRTAVCGPVRTVVAGVGG